MVFRVRYLYVMYMSGARALLAESPKTKRWAFVNGEFNRLKTFCDIYNDGVSDFKDMMAKKKTFSYYETLDNVKRMYDESDIKFTFKPRQNITEKFIREIRERV